MSIRRSSGRKKKKPSPKRQARIGYYTKTTVDRRIADEKTLEPYTDDIDTYLAGLSKNLYDWKGIDDPIPNGLVVEKQTYDEALEDFADRYYDERGDRTKLTEALTTYGNFSDDELKDVINERMAERRLEWAMANINPSFVVFRGTDDWRDEVQRYVIRRPKGEVLGEIIFFRYTGGNEPPTIKITSGFIHKDEIGKGYFQYIRRNLMNYADERGLEVYTNASPFDGKKMKRDQPHPYWDRLPEIAPQTTEELVGSYSSWGNTELRGENTLKREIHD